MTPAEVIDAYDESRKAACAVCGKWEGKMIFRPETGVKEWFCEDHMKELTNVSPSERAAWVTRAASQYGLIHAPVVATS